MLWKFAGMPNVDISILPFNDIGNLTTNQKKAVVWAKNLGIAGGYSDGTFRPNESCLRKQIATFLYRYARSGITQWTCTGCGAQYTNENNAEAHYMGVSNPAVHYAGHEIPGASGYYVATPTYTRPYRVDSDIELTSFYYGFLPWGLQ